MTAVPNQEYTDWNTLRNQHVDKQAEAVLGTSSAALGGSTGGIVAPEYANQQTGSFRNELQIDAGFGEVPYDVYKGEPSGDFGYPVTAALEQEILEAALNAKYLAADTIPAQIQLALMQAARKAHNNWRQRRQQLLTHAQLRAVNRVAIRRDFDTMTSGRPLDGVA